MKTDNFEAAVEAAKLEEPVTRRRAERWSITGEVRKLMAEGYDSPGVITRLVMRSRGLAYDWMEGAFDEELEDLVSTGFAVRQAIARLKRKAAQ